MSDFISLREFLLMKDPYDKHNRSIFSVLERAEMWPVRYDIAKASFEAHGKNGPPIGTNVIALRNGFGGWAGVMRKFCGVNQDDDRFFIISYESFKYGVTRPYWWAEICPATIFNGLDRNIRRYFGGW